ncbi:phosphonate metabolism protein/1,5-bisphosphokinase (PRPP-forming) PhnN [Achromobacter sp. ACM04]|uniref:phosphonate metabolism protein/1,5-bisphosphokinase (PRPP-forming) PhnN n=1 Tax=Achromobacter TaxID=222 RepID=UPI000D3FA968|nr:MULTISPECIES: phosphonate metabolism protein/1,5-bisphosphokinase (PRPP-forming) PhnN [Achromobacter]MBD9419947.1 phosphonate metabolism protein/1,5-bisphosphokinase (PRPP-forming) PhnN [Achromobacter sp. ACM04]MBD9472742.1 phosphonate metabolism protein/1,5-bisphosphokinase (PRPP-forming) PhnN [Achromobacter sp. ACM01]MDQ1762299.1 phosphonate metabolism protein/1,5-bisphosphokinase (PRPP-forming) PhnN [Achromobacter aegrifaciens]PTN39806.1 phosphonate metabolism protein/1,5-bisphosphokinase
MSASVPADGARLIYLMGASGSGKDTLLRLLRAELRGDEPVLVAHRYITRDSGATEDALSLTEDEFGRRAALGCFALRWASHGLHYGIGIEIDAWLSCGAAVIINGSRAHLEQAHSRYPALTAVEVTVDPGQLVSRLAGRGRESAEQIAQRLARATQAFPVPPQCRLLRVSNDAAPETAAAALLNIARDKLNA